jgi:hypothetical protein
MNQRLNKDISNISVTTILGGIGTVFIGGALFVFTAWISHVESSLAEGKRDYHSHTSRLTAVETNYTHILQGLSRIEKQTNRTADKVDKIEDGQTELREKVRAFPGISK